MISVFYTYRAYLATLHECEHRWQHNSWLLLRDGSQRTIVASVCVFACQRRQQPLRSLTSILHHSPFIHSLAIKTATNGNEYPCQATCAFVCLIVTIRLLHLSRFDSTKRSEYEWSEVNIPILNMIRYIVDLGVTYNWSNNRFDLSELTFAYTRTPLGSKRH